MTHFLECLYKIMMIKDSFISHQVIEGEKKALNQQ